jgi:hypothetical protein
MPGSAVITDSNATAPKRRIVAIGIASAGRVGTIALRGGRREKSRAARLKNFAACRRTSSLATASRLCCCRRRCWIGCRRRLVWTVLASVEEMDLSGFYGVYRPDGHGRPGYDPKVMA